MKRSFRQVMAIREKKKKELLERDPLLNNGSGIYVLLRQDNDNNIKYAYVGQAKHLLDRLANHLIGYEQHIDLSLRNHGLYSKNNPTGWNVIHYNVNVEKLDEAEKFYIREYANAGYQLRNKTLGGQGEGKIGMENNAPSKGYRDGIKQGYENCRKDVKEYFEKYLSYDIKEPKFNKAGKLYEIKAKKIKDFEEFLNVSGN